METFFLIGKAVGTELNRGKKKQTRSDLTSTLKFRVSFISLTEQASDNLG